VKYLINIERAYSSEVAPAYTSLCGIPVSVNEPDIE
jgi:hypothetical protein